MSPINFEFLQTEYPELTSAWLALRAWFAKHGRKRYVEWSVLLRALKDVSKPELILAIQVMIEHGMLATTYRFKAPGGQLLEGDYDDPEQLLETELPDRDFSGYVDKEECDIVSGYRWEPVGAS